MIVVEDDYDGEFRCDGQPLESLQGQESLQGLDTEGRRAYMGTISRAMFLVVRVGYGCSSSAAGESQASLRNEAPAVR